MTIIHADILDWARDYSGPKFHALLCDPPYHLTSISDRFGKPDAAPAQYGTDGAFARASKGFMGSQWDGGDIAFQPATWAALAQHLYPGAFGMAFASSRGWHRLACAIEDAGLIIHPSIFGWSYATGFPKATNIAAGIDARAFRDWLSQHPTEAALLREVQQAERAARKAGDATAARAELKAITTTLKAQAGLAPRVVGQKKHQPKFAAAELGYREKDNGYNSRDRETFDLTEPATELAAQWLGHRYGGQAIKPALEPIIVFQKPYDGSALDCITSSGAGALWVDGARISGDGDEPNARRAKTIAGKRSQNLVFQPDVGDGAGWDGGQGRWPANLILSHHPTCNGHCAPGCPVAALGAQSGESSSGGGAGYRNHPDSPTKIQNSAPGYVDGIPPDSGTAARFFFQADYMAERMELADAIQYIAKASAAEREAGLDPRQTALMRLMDEDVEDFEEEARGKIGPSGHAGTVKRCPEHGNARGDGSSYTCGCSTIHGFSESTINDGRETPIDNPYQRGETTRRNIHPTIKPIALTRYLATLLLPPPAYGPRRLLVPFSGAGSEVIGADLAGWEDVTGIEIGAEHVAIANARRAYWQQRRWELGDPARKPTIKAAVKTPAGQADMFDEAA